MKHKVLVTSAGTASAVNVIKSLRRQTDLELEILSVDIDEFAPGLRLADYFKIVNRADAPDYVDSLLDLCRKEGVEILFPIYSREIEIIAEMKDRFSREGVQVLLPGSDSVRTCNDKKRMSELVRRLGIRAPKQYDSDEIRHVTEKDFPLFIKPNKGSSSAGAAKVPGLEALHYLQHSIKDYVVQEFIGGTEVTVDIFCDSDSNPRVISPRERISTKAGQSVKARTISQSRFIDPVTRIVRALSIAGACNIQFMDDGREPAFIEINPRFAAGGLMLTVFGGANIPLLVVKELLHIPYGEKECTVREGLRMTRYWEEIFF